MTNRLYYDDSYLREFDGRVTACRPQGEKYQISLDQSAFYPTSGGQPFDTGILIGACGSLAVEDVCVDDAGEVWHLVETPVPVGTPLHGKIDWERRFDHMQQHGGEHMLAGAVYRLLNGSTIGLHLGKDNSSIDVTLPDDRAHLTKEEINALEWQVNTWIQEDAGVRCWFPEEAELARLPLRKPPTVKTHIRIVAFGDYEMVACGGTHPASAGQVGLLKILSVTPAKGKARITFVCGMRAFRYFSVCQSAAEESGRLLSCPVGDLPGAVERMKAQTLDLQRRLTHVMEKEYIEKMRDSEGNGIACLWLQEADQDALRAAAAAYIRQSGKYVLCGGQGRIIFARSADASGDMGALIRAVARGGGKPDFASGTGDAENLRQARDILMGKS